eukprot:6110786-Alexandrium_andersonii.AAC.1
MGGPAPHRLARVPVSAAPQTGAVLWANILVCSPSVRREAAPQVALSEHPGAWCGSCSGGGAEGAP